MEHFVIDTASLEAQIPSADPKPQPRSAAGSRFPAGFASRHRQVLKAKYDAAGLSPEMEAWWAGSDHLSPQAANSKAVRSRVRRRARYEVYESGSIANGILEALVNHVIGCGPTLQVMTPDKELNRFIEAEWSKYASAIRWTEKLRTMFAAKVVDGEAFAEKVTNNRLPTPVKFDLQLSEADLWTEPFDLQSPTQDDGILYDLAGNPISYKKLRQHPGDTGIFQFDPYATTPVPAEYVIHWFKTFRPGQRRGISEFSMSLRPLAEMRRYQMAVQAAAETAANHSGVMFSTASAYSEDPAEIDPEDIFMNVPVARNSLLTLPEGWDMKQLRAEQPPTHYVEFIEERIAATARPFQMPLNVASGSSRKHNFASAKLDKAQFAMANKPRQKDCAETVCDRVFGWWLFEANRIPEYMPVLPDSVPHVWQWPIDEAVDVVAQARADEIYFHMGWLTDEQYCKRQGLDVDEMHEQWKRQTDARTAAGDNFPQPGIKMSESIMDDTTQEVPVDE